MFIGQREALCCQGGIQALPVGRIAAHGDLGRAIRIVEFENLRLCKYIGCTETCRMVGITIYFDGSPHIVFDDDTAGVSVQDMGSGIEVRQPRHNVGWDFYCRYQGAGRLAGITCIEPTKCERSRHQSQHLPPLTRLSQCLCQAREFSSGTR